MRRVADAVVRRPGRTLVVWAVVVLALVGVGSTTSGHLGAPDLLAEGTVSARALALQDAHFPPTTSLAVVVEGTSGAVDATVPGVLGVVRAHGAAGLLRRPQPGFAVVQADLPRGSGRRPDADNAVVRAVRPGLLRAGVDGARVSLAGTAAVYEELKHTSERAAQRGELIAAPILVLVLLLVLRTPLAAVLALLSGGVAVGAGMGLLRGAAGLSDLTVFSATLTSMMGLALGVDYALLVLFRYREERAAGSDPAGAVRASLSRAGETVVLAGVVLAAAMVVAVLLSDDGLLVSPAIGVLAAAIVALVGALTALPAAILLGHRHVDRLVGDPRPAPAARLGRAAMRRPWSALLLVLVPLGGLAVEGVGLTTGPGDVRQLPSDSSVRGAVERLSSALGPGYTAPFELVASSPRPALAAKVAADPGVAEVLGGGETSRDGRAWRLRVIPRSTANTAAGARATARLQRLAGPGVLVGGVAAELAEFDDATSAQVPRVVVGLTIVGFLALLLVLRAPLLAALSVGLNLLTVAVAFGVIALLFEGADPLLGGSGYQEVIAMVSMFTVMFGLSIDYQVFLLHRMREGLAVTRDARQATGYALDRTAGVVTGAAAIMVGVFLSFSVADVATIRQFGIGLAVAIAVDATLIRLVLLPAAISLIGPRVWWPDPASTPGRR